MSSRLRLLFVAVALLAVPVAPQAGPLPAPPVGVVSTDPDVSQARYGGGHGGAHVGHGGVHGRPHGGAHVVRPGGHYPHHPGYRPGYSGGWARPGYRWAPGGAIAAGAAIGLIGAAAAASFAPPAPAPGLCWYYTDPSRTQGFWDACP